MTELDHHRSIATLARELSLNVAHLDPIGWSATSVPESTAARYGEVLAELAAALVLWRRAEQANPAGTGRSRNALACSSGCGRRIRVARSVLEQAPILCGACARSLRTRERRGPLTRTSPLQKCLGLMGHDAAGAVVQRWWHGLVREDGTRVAVGEESVQVGMDEHALALRPT